MMLLLLTHFSIFKQISRIWQEGLDYWSKYRNSFLNYFSVCENALFVNPLKAIDVSGTEEVSGHALV